MLTNSFGRDRDVGGDSAGEDVLGSQLLLCCTSATLMTPNCKTDEVGRDFWRSSSPSSLLKVGTTVSKEPFLVVFSRMEISQPPWTPIPVFHFQSEGLNVYSCISVWALGTTEKSLSLYLFPSDIFTYKAHLKPSLLCMKQSQLFQDRMQLQGTAIKPY